jgi:hypothetical protein
LLSQETSKVVLPYPAGPTMTVNAQLRFAFNSFSNLWRGK